MVGGGVGRTLILMAVWLVGVRVARISRADPVGGGEEYADQGRMVSARRKLRLDFQTSPCLRIWCRWVSCGCDRIGWLVGYRGLLAVGAAVSFGFMARYWVGSELHHLLAVGAAVSFGFCFVQPFGMGV